MARKSWNASFFRVWLLFSVWIWFSAVHCLIRVTDLAQQQQQQQQSIEFMRTRAIAINNKSLQCNIILQVHMICTAFWDRSWLFCYECESFSMDIYFIFGIYWTNKWVQKSKTITALSLSLFACNVTFCTVKQSNSSAKQSSVSNAWFSLYLSVCSVVSVQLFRYVHHSNDLHDLNPRYALTHANERCTHTLIFGVYMLSSLFIATKKNGKLKLYLHTFTVCLRNWKRNKNTHAKAKSTSSIPITR